MIDPLTPGDVARLRGCTPQAVRRACIAGRLASRRIGRQWFVERADALAWEGPPGQGAGGGRPTR